MLEQTFCCVDCGKVSPPTDEGETITRQHGWRLMRRMSGDGPVIEPRCPECFARFKASMPPSSGKKSG